MKREAPYNRLKRICRQWAHDNILGRDKRHWMTLDLENTNYNLTYLTSQIQTASRLGYTVELTVNEDSKVVFTYVKKLPHSLPWELRP